MGPEVEGLARDLRAWRPSGQPIWRSALPCAEILEKSEPIADSTLELEGVTAGSSPAVCPPSPGVADPIH